MKRLVLAALLMVIAACQNTHTRQHAPPHLMRIGPVPENDISGRCGLSLKALSGPPSSTGGTVFFQEPGKVQALIALNGTAHPLRQMQATRDTLDGFPSLQHFKAGNMTARLTLRRAPGDKQEGSSTHIGVLMVNKTDGWSTIIPVSGTIACK